MVDEELTLSAKPQSQVIKVHWLIYCHPHFYMRPVERFGSLLRHEHALVQRESTRTFSRSALRPEHSHRDVSQQPAPKHGSPRPDLSEHPLPSHSEPSKQRSRLLRNAVILVSGVAGGYALNTFLSSGSSSLDASKAQGFKKYSLVGKDDLSPTSSIFTLRASSGELRAALAREEYQRAITSTQIKQPQLQIARSYTLLPPISEQNQDDIRFLIRKENKGEVSGYLHRLAVGAEIELRGPYVEYAISDDVQEVLFLAGGTGIAPAMQVADALAREANVHVLWANRRKEDCKGGISDTAGSKRISSWDFYGWWSPFGLPSADIGKTVIVPHAEKSAIVRQLDSIKNASKGLQVDYYIDEENRFISAASITKLVATRTSNAPKQTGKKLIIVSGPEGFVNYWAGPKQWSGGREVQGPLGGVLATLDTSGWDVVKL